MRCLAAIKFIATQPPAASAAWAAGSVETGTWSPRSQQHFAPKWLIAMKSIADSQGK
jgi:hypothetical protein